MRRSNGLKWHPTIGPRCWLGLKWPRSSTDCARIRDSQVSCAVSGSRRETSRSILASRRRYSKNCACLNLHCGDLIKRLSQ